MEIWKKKLKEHGSNILQMMQTNGIKELAKLLGPTYRDAHCM
jgi:hypothetical protein